MIVFEIVVFLSIIFLVGKLLTGALKRRHELKMLRAKHEHLAAIEAGKAFASRDRVRINTVLATYRDTLPRETIMMLEAESTSLYLENER